MMKLQSRRAEPAPRMPITSTFTPATELPAAANVASMGAAQVRAARAASAASLPVATSSALPPQAPVSIAQPITQVPQQQAPYPSTHPVDPAGAAASGAITSHLPSKIAVIVDELIEDRSVKRVNAQGVVVYKQYRRGRYLGKGGFAKCYELTSLDSGRTYAGKIIPKASLAKPSAKKKLLNEIKIHRSIQHINVVKFERFFEDKNNVYILLEICSNHTLMELMKRRQRMTETETQFYMWQLTNTMIFLHSHNVIHRDLKLGNLFLNEHLDIRIGDFGLAAQLEHPDERKRTICGTPNYIAPEILDNSNGHSFEVDTWAMGVIMYTLLIGQPPFETASVKTTYKKIRDNSYEFPSHIHISPAARSLIERILSSSPQSRPSLKDMKNDVFFTQSPFPKQLPITCLNQPLQWKHAVNDAPHYQPSYNNENSAVAMGVPPSAAAQAVVAEKLGAAAPAALAPVQNAAPRAALTTRTAMINVPAPVIVDAGKNAVASVVKPTAVRPTTAPVTVTAAPKSNSPLAAAPPNPKRQSGGGAASSQVENAVAFQPAPSPTYTAVDAHAKGFFKELTTPVTAAAVAPITTAVPKRVSGERRVTRRSGQDEKEREQDELIHQMRALELAKSSTAAASVAASEDIPGEAPEAEAGATEGGEGDVEDEEEAGALRKMHDEIERSFCVQPDAATAAKAAATPTAQTPLVPADLWVNKWVDYSNKYGLGYLLSNGDSGVYFNDSSKAILSADGEHFEYLERKPSASATSPSSAAAAAAQERQSYTLNNYPSTLQKKVTLLKHFMNYLVVPSDSPSATPTPTPSSASTPPSNLVYVKKWLRTKHAIFFRLSNRTVQVIFLDHTELLLSSQHNSVTYTDKSKKRETFSLDRVGGEIGGMNEKPDLAKRMKYTKDILHHLLSRTNAAAAAAAEKK